jgi:hypothetical protein
MAEAVDVFDVYASLDFLPAHTVKTRRVYRVAGRLTRIVV